MLILKPETEEGNVEYKRCIINLDDSRLEQLATQMNWRLLEGDNEAIYYLGINDNGTLYNMSKKEKKETFDNFNLLVDKNKAEITNRETIKLIEKNKQVMYYKFTVRKKNKIYPEIRILLLGDSGSGKTTFLANVLLSKYWDPNNKSKIDPRIYLMNHKHEIESKKTSSTNCNYQIYNNIKYTFIEAPGCTEYSRTKYKLILSTDPDIVILFKNPNGEINQYDNFIVGNLFKISACIQINIFDKDSLFYSGKPIDKLELYNLINLKYEQKLYDTSIEKTKFTVLNMYPHNDLGLIVSGLLVSGTLKIGQYIEWNFQDKNTNCKIQSIHVNTEPVNRINASQLLTVCLKTNSQIVKSWKHGMLSTDIKLKPTKAKINFIFKNFSTHENLPKSIYVYCLNKIHYIYSIEKFNDSYTGIISYYIPGDNVMIVDSDNLKGVILQIHKN